MTENQKTDTAKTYGLVAIGNALVDVLALVDDGFIEEHSMTKGGSELINEKRAAKLQALLTPEKEVSGGSAANTLSGFVSYGGRGAFIGKIAADPLGDVFRDDMAAQGIHFAAIPHEGGPATGSCQVLVTPDGERTMNTCLGINTHFGAADIDLGLIEASKIVLLEGYLYDQPDTRAAFNHAAHVAREAGTKVAFTLSDHGCVARHRSAFRDLVQDHVDILFGNEKEIKALTAKQDFNEAVNALPDSCAIKVITRGSKGALIIANGKHHVIDPVKPSQLADTTGAGDAFAAGVLYGLSEGMDVDRAGALGAMAASYTISHIGARNPAFKFSTFLSPA